jgi:hypothetical protein
VRRSSAVAERGGADERGYVTAETALLLPALFAVGYALMLAVVLVGDQLRCTDAAWEAARELARGVPSSQLPALADRFAPGGSRAREWSARGELTVEVGRDQSIASRLLPSIHISGTVTVPCEPRVDC